MLCSEFIERGEGLGLPSWSELENLIVRMIFNKIIAFLVNIIHIQIWSCMRKAVSLIAQLCVALEPFQYLDWYDMHPCLAQLFFTISLLLILKNVNIIRIFEYSSIYHIINRKYTVQLNLVEKFNVTPCYSPSEIHVFGLRTKHLC